MISKCNVGTPGGIQYFGELEEHCYWGNERHADACLHNLWLTEWYGSFVGYVSECTMPRTGRHFPHIFHGDFTI